MAKGLPEYTTPRPPAVPEELNQAFHDRTAAFREFIAAQRLAEGHDKKRMEAEADLLAFILSHAGDLPDHIQQYLNNWQIEYKDLKHLHSTSQAASKQLRNAYTRANINMILQKQNYLSKLSKDRNDYLKNENPIKVSATGPTGELLKKLYASIVKPDPGGDPNRMNKENLGRAKRLLFDR